MEPAVYVSITKRAGDITPKGTRKGPEGTRKGIQQVEIIDQHQIGQST